MITATASELKLVVRNNKKTLMKTIHPRASYSGLPPKPHPELEPQAIPPDRAPALPEYRPEQEKVQTPPPTPEVFPEPNHPPADPDQARLQTFNILP